MSEPYTFGAEIAAQKTHALTGNSTLGYAYGNLSEPTPVHPCRRDTHYFECKHEQRCYCGMTERLPLEMRQGL